MDKKTIFGKAIAWITKAVQTVKDLISSGTVDKKLDEVVDIVNVIKQYADSPIAVIMVKLTPFNWDDIGREWLVKFLQKVLDKYKTLKTSSALQEIAGTIASKKTGLPLVQAKVRVEEAYQESKVLAL